MKYLLLTSFFLLSLLSHGYIPYLFGLIFLGLYVFLKRGVLFNQKVLYFIFIFLIILHYQAIVFFVDFFGLANPVSIDSFYNNYLYSYFILVLLFLLFLLFSMTSEKNKVYRPSVTEEIRFALSGLIVIHVSLFIIQFLIVHLTGYYLDMVKPFTGEESRYFNYFLYASNLPLEYRVTGFYVEPSTYVAAMVSIILASLIVGVHRYIVFIASISMLFSFSTVGILFFAILIFAYTVSNLRLNLRSVLSVLVVAGFVLFFMDIIFYFFVDFFNKFYTTVGSRLTIFNGYIFHPVYGLNLFGYGYFNISKESYEYASNNFGAVNDSGLLAFVIMKFGFVPVLMLLLVLTRFKRGLMASIFLFLAFISKISYVHPVFLIALMAYIFYAVHFLRKPVLMTGKY